MLPPLQTHPFDCVFLELTNRCNLRCRFCPNTLMTRPRGDMDPGLAKSLLEEIARAGICRWVNLSLMGEPLLYPHLLEVARRGADLGVPLHLITNCSLLTSRMLRDLIELPLTHLTLSLQAPDARTFGLKGAGPRFSFEAQLAVVEEAVKTKFSVGSPTEISIHLLTTRLERPRGISILERTAERLAAAERFRRLAASWVDLPTPRPGLAGRPLEILRFWLGLEGYIPLCEGVSLFFKRATLWANTLLVEDVEVEPRGQGTCQLALDTLGILWDGRVTLCCLDFDGILSFGDVREGGLAGILDSGRYAALRASFEQGRLPHDFCRRCRGRLVGPGAGRLLPASFPALVGEGWRYLRRFRLDRTLKRIPQEVNRYLRRR